MKEDTLLFFNSPSELISFIYELDIYNGWKIQQGRMNDRGSKIYDRQYVKILRDAFNNRDFFRRKVSIAEIVSWLDTLTLVKRLLVSLRSQLDNEEYDGIKIYCEYMIQMSKKMRIDYVLEYDDRLLLLEFRTVSNFEKLRPTWQMKFHELLVYKELMGYYLPNQYVRLYAFISMYEYEGNTLIKKHKEYNDNQVTHLTEYIKRYLFNKK